MVLKIAWVRCDVTRALVRRCANSQELVNEKVVGIVRRMSF